MSFVRVSTSRILIPSHCWSRMEFVAVHCKAGTAHSMTLLQRVAGGRRAWPALRQHVASGASFSSSPLSSSSSTLPAAVGLAALGGGFVAGYSWLMSSPSVSMPGEVEVITSQAQLDELRTRRFNEGIREAFTGAVRAR